MRRCDSAWRILRLRRLRDLNDNWVIALRSSSGHEFEDDISETLWRFRLAPRGMQNEAVAKIPGLIDILTEQTRETRDKLKSRAEQAIQLAALVEEVSMGESDWLTKLQAGMFEFGLRMRQKVSRSPKAKHCRSIPD